MGLTVFALAATPPAKQQAERVYIVLNTLFNPHFNFNGAWVTHDRFLDSQLGGSPAGPQTFRGNRSNQRKKKKKKDMNSV
jgi:hypothetical protein